MNDKEMNFFGTISDMFGDKTSKVMYNLYVDFIHDMKMFGLILSYPFMFVKFWKQSWNKLNDKKYYNHSILWSIKFQTQMIGTL